MLTLILVGAQHMAESHLVRDTLYLMQGISGKYIKFAPSKEDVKTLVFTADVVSVSLGLIILGLLI